MAKDDGVSNPPSALKPIQNLNFPRKSPSTDGNRKTLKKFIQSVAVKISAHPFRCSDPKVWGVLTAISEKARKRPQGMHMLLTSNVHEIGRVVDDYHFCLDSPAISDLHCMIYRKRAASEDKEHRPDMSFSVFLKDYSKNGTLLNWEKLNKRTHEAIRHGDIISFAFAPKHEHVLVFVFREVQQSSCVSDGSSLKRKPERYGAKNKRLKKFGVGPSDGPISLDDFRSLQRSNTELRESKETIAKSHQDQLRQLNQSLEAKEKELEELTKIYAGLKHGMEDLNERLSASTESCLEATETINSQKASISELKAVLDEERDQRRREREKESLDMKMALQSLRKELECEKAVQEEAWAKVSALELEIIAAVRDLDIERRRLEGARERILLRETQLHALYSTSEKISVLFAMQQEQFKAMQRTLEGEENTGALFSKQHEQFESMQRTLEDEQNYGAASIDINLNRDENRSIMDRDNNNKEVAHQSNSTTAKDQVQIFSDEASLTKKNDHSNARSQENIIDTHEIELNRSQCGINNHAKGAFCSNIDVMMEISHGDAIGTEHIPETEGISTSPAFEGTEHVLEMERQIARILIDLNKNAMNSPGMHDSSSLVVEVTKCHQPRREGLRPRRGTKRVQR